MSDSFAQRLREWRLARHMSQTHLGLALGYEGGHSISFWERGKSSPSVRTQEKIFEALHVPGRDTFMRHVNFWCGPIAVARGLDGVHAAEVDSTGGDNVVVNVYKGVPLAWDHPQAAKLDSETIPRYILPRGGDGVVVVIPIDDSMELTYASGRSRFLVDTTLTRLKSRRIYCLVYKGKGLIRNVVVERRHIILQSLNRAEYPDLVVHSKEVKVLGQVVDIRIWVK